MKGNKAQVFNLFTWMIVAFLTVVLFSGLIYVMGILNDTFHQVGVLNDQVTDSCNNFNQTDCNLNVNTCTWHNSQCVRYFYTNMTQASDSIFGQMNTSIQALRLVAIVYILAEAVVFLIMNAFMRKNPLFFFAYVLIILLAVLFAPTISNAYYNLLQSSIFNGELNNFTASNFIILNLPTIVMVLGFLGGIFMFIRFLNGGYSNEFN